MSQKVSKINTWIHVCWKFSINYTWSWVYACASLHLCRNIIADVLTKQDAINFFLDWLWFLDLNSKLATVWIFLSPLPNLCSFLSKMKHISYLKEKTCWHPWHTAPSLLFWIDDAALWQREQTNTCQSARLGSKRQVIAPLMRVIQHR